MPRVHSQKAAKDYPESGIKKGEVYYKWSFRYGGTHKSKTYPKPSQLTQSAFLSPMYALQEQVEALSIEDLKGGAVEEIIDEIRGLGDEAQDSFDNMPEALQYGPTGELLEQRVEMAEEFASNLEGVEIPEEVEEPGDEPEEPTTDEPQPEDFGDDEEAYEAAHAEWQDERDEWEQEFQDWEEAKDAYDEQDELFEQALNELQGYGYEGE